PQHAGTLVAGADIVPRSLMSALPSTDSTVTRDKLLIAYHPLVRMLAMRLARRLPPSVDVHELINVGMLGLIDAVDRFDSTRGVPLKSYAEIRIQGAMIDTLRQNDWIPRSVRRRSNHIEQTRTRLSQRLGRLPTRAEMASGLGIAVRDFDTLLCNSRINNLVSLDASTTEDGHIPLVESIVDNTKNPEALLDSAELKGLLNHAVRDLPEKERLAVTRSYLQGFTLKRIGDLLGVSESRVCQLRGQGIRRLRLRMQHMACVV
ncbi:MAG: RNA polymerase sigma factor for flagellar operon FliA, partial [Myxococcota bacterium]